MSDPFKEPGVLLRPFCRNCESLCEVGETECCDKPIGGWTWGHEVRARAAEVDDAIRDVIATKAHAAGYAEAVADVVAWIDFLAKREPWTRGFETLRATIVCGEHNGAAKVKR